MKIRHPAAMKLVGLLGSWAISAYMKTISHRHYWLGLDPMPTPPNQGRILYAFWHENLVTPTYYFARRDIKALVSQHADGEMIARVCHHLGYGLIRGSTTRGSLAALRQMIKDCSRYSLAVSPDGPRGPRRQVEPGVVYLAAKTGVPIVPLGAGYSNVWRLKTWDRFCIPKPFSQVVTVFGEPLYIPPRAGRDELAAFGLKVRDALNHACDYAQNLVDGTIPRALKKAA